MMHLSPERLSELGMSASPTPDEQTHLHACEACAKELAAEEQLSRTMAALPQPAIDPRFVERTTQAFTRARARRRHQRLGITITAVTLSLVTGLATLGLLATSLGWLARFGLRFVTDAALLLNSTVTLFRVAPVVPVLLVVGCALALTASSFLLRAAAERARA